MKLLDVIKVMEVAAAQQPAVNMIVRNDVFRLNTYADAQYGVFAWTQGQHQQLSEDVIRFSFSLFYVDRLTEDHGNQVEIQSVGIDVLANVIRTMADAGCFPGAATYTTFNQRFLDECAGVFAGVTFDVPVDTLCPESFADLNEDFNEDFLII